MTRTTKKKQEQLALPELEPAFALEIQGEQPVTDSDKSQPPAAHATNAGKPRRSSRTRREPTRKASPRTHAAKKTRSTAATVLPLPEMPAITLLNLPAFQPQLNYNRQEDSLCITLLAEPVREDRSSSQLSAGYTADGRLAEIRIYDLARQVLPAQIAAPADSNEGAELLTSIRDELLFLKAGLALVLAGVLWLLLK